MQELLDFILKMITAALFLYVINTLFMISVPYHWMYLVLIAFLGIKGLLIVLIIHYFFL